MGASSGVVLAALWGGFALQAFFASCPVLLGSPKMIKIICKTAIESVDFRAFFESARKPKSAKIKHAGIQFLVVFCVEKLIKTLFEKFVFKKRVRTRNDHFEGAKLAPRSTRIAPNHPEKWLQKWLPDRRILVVICKIPLRRSIKFCPNFLSPNPIFFRSGSEIGGRKNSRAPLWTKPESYLSLKGW